MFWNISIKVQNKIETQIRIKIAVEVPSVAQFIMKSSVINATITPPIDAIVKFSTFYHIYTSIWQIST